MDLILWRHAEAEAAEPVTDASQALSLDLRRALTGRGQKHAARMAAWLEQRLPDGARILVSPALRCEQTALNLGRKFRICEELGPQGQRQHLLNLAHWPDGKVPVLIIGHQPTLGQTVAHLLGLSQTELSIRKGALWWLRHRIRDGQPKTLLMAVQSPDLL